MRGRSRLSFQTATLLIGLALILAVTRLSLSGGFPDGLFQFHELSPFRSLPMNVQAIVTTLITIPVGVIALVIIRQFVGIPTLGTFMPVLIGVALREAGPVTGLILFLSILFIAILARWLFGRMHLLLVPRLTAVLIVVIITMITAICATAWTNIPMGTSTTLFPLVILAMTTERLVITLEESGPRTAFAHLAGSLFIALLSYVFMTFPFVETVMFALPELLLVILALTIFMGRYLGFRLTEYIRFRHLGEPK